MSGASAAPVAPPGGVHIAVPVESSSLWNRISNWASENKAVVYTIAGVTLVATSAGVVYYLNSVSLVWAAATYSYAIGCMKTTEPIIYSYCRNP
jgi:hypothetical protein